MSNPLKKLNKINKNLNPNQRKLFATFVFLAKMLVFAIPFYAIMSIPGILLPLQDIVSQNVESILRFMGFAVSRHGFLLTAGGIAFFISEDCTGWKSMTLLTALIFAVPGVKLKKRLVGATVGIAAIYAGNLVRIIAVVSIWNGYGYALASLVHDYLWQAGLVSLVLALWVCWMVWAGKIETTFFKRIIKIIKPGKPRAKIKKNKVAK